MPGPTIILLGTGIMKENFPSLNKYGFNSPPALLQKSAADRTSPFPGQIYPAISVTGVPSAVKPLSTATRTWNSAT